MNIFTLFKSLTTAAKRFRSTPVVDDDFPDMRDEFDNTLRDAILYLDLMEKRDAPVMAGYMANARGGLDRIENIDEIDKLRDDFVMGVIARASVINKLLRDFKEDTLAEIQAFIQLSANEYKREFGGKKGNVSFISHDGKYKVARANHDFVTFDERMLAAKELFLECARDWASSPNVPNDLVILVEGHFRLNRNGDVSVSEVMRLMQYKIADPRWRTAVEMLKDSIRVQSTVTYLRIFERVGSTDQYKAIPLDIAKV